MESIDEQYVYYVVEGYISTDPHKNLKSRIRILQVPVSYGFVPNNSISHDSIRHLRQFDSKWRLLKSKQSKLADEICKDKFIIKARGHIVVPNDINFHQYAFDILQHSIHGKYDKQINGIHLLTLLNKDITEIEEINPPDTNGVWEAKVKVYNELREKTYEKISTFFPITWTPSDLMNETSHAISQIQVETNISCYESQTKSHVPVKIIIQNNRVKTIYPIYTNLIL